MSGHRSVEVPLPSEVLAPARTQHEFQCRRICVITFYAEAHRTPLFQLVASQMGLLLQLFG